MENHFLLLSIIFALTLLHVTTVSAQDQSIIQYDSLTTSQKDSLGRFDPELIYKPSEIIFPDSLRERAKKASIIVAALIDTSGNVQQVKIASSSDPVLNDCYLSSVSMYRFAIRKSAKPKRPVWILLPVKFRR